MLQTCNIPTPITQCAGTIFNLEKSSKAETAFLNYYQTCTSYLDFFNVAKGSFNGWKYSFQKSAKLVLGIFISCQKLYYSNTLSLESAKIEILMWELAWAWRLKLGRLEMITRWCCFSYKNSAICTFQKFFERRQTWLI